MMGLTVLAVSPDGKMLLAGRASGGFLRWRYLVVDIPQEDGQRLVALVVGGEIELFYESVDDPDVFDRSAIDP